ncbi:double Clp-N motif-containing P-loop nucleoside triphosphate hydrolases superfamily protein [Artemisia annua]|uniref:Double Clp-N motif-containing P-loop nucleoside triphosphate hydrolases superfamily protein n=1 Tax=Artemisia annua TaxID=35608 RepID=A0A2U1KPR9_ARTAN|nr:double Clp-N motif-containing P-loop nucleoside triphosphate hydrolases superfamily protein [Artemisia annua]
MRAGGFTIQQALSSDAATIIKQSVTLARRRGHAQVTPLHVANTMLSGATGLLRTACLQSQSHSHPLQCKALELCFNVALNRLPTSSSNPMIGSHHSQHPSISNALVAAFKRAQAHQRRGSIENQQQPLLAVKIELEQLVISILDDPSVSRVMREAGFSSTQVKTNVEQVVSLELSSQTPSKECTKENSGDNRHLSQVTVRNEDVTCVIEHLVNKQRSHSVVVVGECVATIEGVVKRVMEKVDKGEVHETLKDVKFISIPLFSFGQLSRCEVEQKLSELRSLVKGFLQRGVVLYLGDLKWISEFRISSWGRGRGYYCPIEHLIIELGRLVCGIKEEVNAKLWLMGISSLQTYMKCRNGNPSLEIVWKLHPLTIPAGSLSLTLVSQSDIQSERECKHADNGDSRTMLASGDQEKQLTCCVDCTINFESEAKGSRSSSLPSWLADEKIMVNSHDKECVSVKDLCKKWNSICTSVHRNKPLFQRSLSFSSISPYSPASCFSYNQQNPSSNRTSSDRKLWDFTALEKSFEPYHIHDEGEPRLGFQSNPNSTPVSGSSSDHNGVEYVQRFKEFNGENLKILCNVLEEKVPWQKDIVPDIASTILKCRSGMVRRKHKLNNGEPKEETWFFFQGTDSKSKEKIAKELANIVFGSDSNYTTIALSNFSSSPRVDSTDESRNKRSRDEQSCSYLERFAEAVSVNPHRVFLVEDVDQVDYCSQMGIKRAIERGKLTHSNGEELGFCDAIILLSCESFSSRSRQCSPQIKQKVQEEGSPCLSLDLNISFDEDNEEQSKSIDDLGLLECVDKCINFKSQDLSL